jgi:hypothetical protein
MQPFGITWDNTKFQKGNQILILAKLVMLSYVTIWLGSLDPLGASPAVRVPWNVL